ncbi:MAG TPA: aspartyl protease family protein [Candidatus Baltobacteraceae bacterium]|jgi:hypothetical protein|nr:aspartyl protease family protein [Candidatus Baltobacteraceae bacterium]
MKITALLFAALLATTPALAQDHAHAHQAAATVTGSTTVPFRLYGNHIYVKATVDGKAYAFVFDTGGAASLSSIAEKQLKLPVVATAQISGTGNSAEPMGVVVPTVASLGDARLKKAYFLVLPAAIDLGSPYEGLQFGGVLGREFFAQLIVTIDYAHKTLTLANPQVFRVNPKATALPLTLRSGVFPNVRAAVDGIEGSFDLDAGSPQALMLSERFANAGGFVAKMPRTVEATPGRGVGGVMTGIAGRVDTLNLGGSVLSDPVAYVVHASGGVFSAPDLDGNIGTDILRRFTVTIDVPDKTLYLAKNEEFGAPFTFTRTGIAVNRVSGATVVAWVIPDSPAQQAGIRQGDTLVAIGGRSAAALSPDQIKDYWTMPAGTALRVTVSRGGKPFDVTLTLRDLL